MRMKITKNNLETLVRILDVIQKCNCTVDDAKDILHYAAKAIQSKAMVPFIDYRKELKPLFESLPKEEQ